MNSATQPLFTHNCQIKNSLALLIMDNGSHKNLISQELVNRLHLITTPHPNPYHLEWVQKDGPHLLLSQRYLVTFSIRQLKDTILCDVSPLDCLDLLLGIPYQAQRNAIYMAKSSQYKLRKYGQTYILTTTTPKPPSTKDKILNVHLNQCVFLCLVRLGSALPNAPTYRLAPRETEVRENQLTDLINSDHLQPSYSPCAPTKFMRLINAIFRNHLGHIVGSYLDDILIFSRTWDTYLQHDR